jgi:hypothetical protein
VKRLRFFAHRGIPEDQAIHPARRKNLFVRLSQLKSTAIERTPARRAARSTGISAKINPGDAVATSEGDGVRTTIPLRIPEETIGASVPVPIRAVGRDRTAQQL